MALLIAITHNCTCETGESATRACCPAHSLLHEQRVLDGLLFARRIEVQLVAEEFSDAA